MKYAVHCSVIQFEIQKSNRPHKQKNRITDREIDSSLKPLTDDYLAESLTARTSASKLAQRDQSLCLCHQADSLALSVVDKERKRPELWLSLLYFDTNG